MFVLQLSSRLTNNLSQWLADPTAWRHARGWHSENHEVWHSRDLSMCFCALRWWPAAEDRRLILDGTAFILTQGRPPKPSGASLGLSPGLGDYCVVKQYDVGLEQGDELFEVLWGHGFFALCMQHSLQVHEAPHWDCSFQLQHDAAINSWPPWFPNRLPLEVTHGIVFGDRSRRCLLSKQDGVWAVRHVSSADEAELLAAAAKHPCCNVRASAEVQLYGNGGDVYRITLAFSTHTVSGTGGDPGGNIVHAPEESSLCWLPDGSGVSLWLRYTRWVVFFQ